MAQVCDDRNPVVIKREDAQPVVLLSLEEYQSLAETAYLLRSPTNAKRLLHSIAELESGKGQTRELME
ncbi:MAG: type II toxin-antitoxin system Phd/YefM family antitoxin [Prochlorotrichaceae cyanobacterium]|jgi:antitoxin YefM